ncbi:RAB6A-GEF complex partner protein 2 [Amyelois transitella]|uniref:RAB6A-GEF complex partner protein 2 n=1 Tax=Amyelois transitella TaxID=680683 RepID=UPI00298FACB9|nr:RAB6A-GEF complex partner protein 2 [Amyelois transitella]XP_060805270.1 RAB6A-GEF complex partner protein 2 [Amyelois transitella]
MIELSAKLTTGTVYLAGEALECCITFCHTTQPEHRNSQSHSDILESLAWVSAQIHCFFSTSGNSGEKTPTIGRTTALEVTSCDVGEVVFHTKPKILFCDLTIPLGETKTFWYRESIPIEAPPSYRGTSVKYSYKITIATQKVGSHIKMVRIPFRVLPISPIINMQDLAALCGNETTEELQPTNPFSEERKVETALTMALQVLQNLTARRSPNSYMITNTRGKVGRFCLFKSAYKLGEDIVGTFDFSVGTVTCMQVSVSLQPEEVIKSKSPSKTANKETLSRSMTVARYHEFTLGLSQAQLILSIPLHITPAFEGDQVSLRWRLHFEFVTTCEKLLPNAEDDSWKAPLNIAIETMVWNLPVKIYSTLPKQIQPHSAGNDAYTMLIK